MTETLREYIEYFIKINDKEWEELSSLFTVVSYKKGELIYGESDISKSFYFVLNGLIRSYKFEENGKDFTWTFHCLDMRTINHRMLIDVAVVDYVSFTQNCPEELLFEVLIDATLVKIEKQELLALFESNLKWQKFATKMAEDAYAVLRERTFNLLTKDAKKRLEILITYFPYVFDQDIPTEYIASYLGITRQSLNRLKKELNITKIKL